MKYHVLSFFRTIRMLTFLDRCKYTMHRLNVRSANTRFKQELPDFKLPPYALAFDAYNSVSWDDYYEVGKLHGKVFADIINERNDSDNIRVLDWGCGPARIIRHLPSMINGTTQLVGIDYNPDSVKWCKLNFPDIEFYVNGHLPPTDLPDDSFDFVYNFSVLTHLSENAQFEWIKELFRVLRPGGWLVCTTHGDNYRHLLTDKQELQAFDKGEAVIQGGYSEGKKWFLAIHPKKFVRDKLLDGFDSVELVQVKSGAKLIQDVWVARKPL